jgi:hypothetical protein
MSTSLKDYGVIKNFITESTDLCAKHNITFNQLLILYFVQFNQKADMYKYIEECAPKASASMFLEVLESEGKIAFLGENNAGNADYAYLVNSNLKDDLNSLFKINLSQISDLRKQFEAFFQAYPAVVTSDGKRLTLKAVPKSEVYKIFERLIVVDGENPRDIINGTKIGAKNNLINCKITKYLEATMWIDMLNEEKKESRFDGLDSQKLSL